MSDIVSLQEWSDQFCRHTVTELYRLILDQEKVLGPDGVRNLTVNFLASFISTVVFKALNERPADIKTREEMLAFQNNNFADLKIKIQDSVSAGFQSAMSTYLKKPFEYYCQIRPVPEPLNKKVC